MKKMSVPSEMLTRGKLVLGLKIAVIVFAVSTVFRQDLFIVANDALHTEFMSHILAIPFLFAYLLYRKRKMLRAVVPLGDRDQPERMKYLPTTVGIILSATAIFLYWHGSYTFTPLEYHMITLPIFTAGLILILFNAQTLRKLAFPLAFLLFLTPPPSEILYTLGSTLSVISSETSYKIVNSLGIPSTLTVEFGNPMIQITRPDGYTISFVVDIACSGIYGLIGFLIFAVFISYIVRDRAWKKAVLFALGFSLTYIINIARITTILLVGYFHGEELALQLFHMLGGWVLIFAGTLLLLLFADRFLHAKLFARPHKCVACNQNLEANRDFCLTCGKVLKQTYIKFRKTDLIKMTAIVFITVLLMTIQVPVFALTEGPAKIVIQTPAGEQGNTQLLPEIQEYTLKFAYRDRSFEERAGQDASLLYSYLPRDEAEKPVWVSLEIASSISTLHRWEVCLISWRISHELPVVVTQLALKDVKIQENPPIIARYFAFHWRWKNITQAVLYWYETSRFVTNDTITQEKNVKISLIAYPDAPTDVAQAETQLVRFAVAIADHWQPIKTWSQIALFFSRNGAYLAATASALLAAILGLHVLGVKKQRKANARAYRKLSKTNQQIIDAVHQTQKTTTGTLNNIAKTYQTMTHKSITPENLHKKLKEAEEAGLIRRQVINQQDEPLLTWKTLVY